MRFELKVVIGFIVTLSLVFLLGIYTYYNNDKQLKASRWVNHTHQVLYQAEQLLSSLTDIETGQRGFCLTNNEAFLTPYTKGKDSILPQLKKMKVLTADNSRQYARVLKLEKLIQQKLIFCDDVVKLHLIDPKASVALIMSLKGKKLMDNIRHTFADLMTEEKTLLEDRTLENDKKADKASLVFIITFSIILLILIILFYTIYLNLRGRTLAEQELIHALKDVEDLYDNAPCGYHSLDSNGVFLQVNNTLCEWLGYKKEEIIGKRIFDLMTEEGLKNYQENTSLLKEKWVINNVQMELVRKNQTSFPVIVNSTAVKDEQGNYLKSRTTTFDYTEQKQANDKIQNLNQELEAFTYTVSHDLRSPLRSISGYAQILEEDYSTLLDDEGKRVTNVIIKSSKRMGQLIDDLLNFSQIGRKELSSHAIDVNVMVQQLVSDFTEQEKQQTLEINLQRLDPCLGDYNLLRQVWYNLLSNAIKYSQKKASVRIEIGSYIIGHETIYYVKDNGAGFDMQYVHKLFGVFQRLHRINEFDGTGVGLAIVKRIVTRHGGRVWAEGLPDLGATFYFSIPNLQTI